MTLKTGSELMNNEKPSNLTVSIYDMNLSLLLSSIITKNVHFSNNIEIRFPIQQGNLVNRSDLYRA